MRFIESSTPLSMVAPPGWRAQSKSVAEGMGEGEKGGEGEGERGRLVVVVMLSWTWGGREWMSLLNAGGTAADAITGTRGVSTTFQPGKGLIVSQIYVVANVSPLPTPFTVEGKTSFVWWGGGGGEVP